MLKSIAAVLGSYLLSVVLVVATDPLLSRLFPGDFVKGRVPSNTSLLASTTLFVLISILCAWLCARFAPSRAPRHVLVLCDRGGHGHRRDRSQLEQRLAALVLALMAARVASELLDRPGDFAPPATFARMRSSSRLRKHTWVGLNRRETVCRARASERHPPQPCAVSGVNYGVPRNPSVFPDEST